MGRPLFSLFRHNLHQATEIPPKTRLKAKMGSAALCMRRQESPAQASTRATLQKTCRQGALLLAAKTFNDFFRHVESSKYFPVLLAQALGSRRSTADSHILCQSFGDGVLVFRELKRTALLRGPR